MFPLTMIRHLRMKMQGSGYENSEAGIQGRDAGNGNGCQADRPLFRIIFRNSPGQKNIHNRFALFLCIHCNLHRYQNGTGTGS